MEKKKIWISNDTHKTIKINASKENMNMSEYVDYLINNKNEKYIRYLDLPYPEKRIKLRQFYFYDADTFEFVNYVIDKCDKNEFFDDKFLNALLVDGYYASEKIYDDNDNIIKYDILDPNSLTAFHDTDAMNWILFNDNTNLKRILNKEQVLYISYSDIFENSHHTSLVEQLMITDLGFKNNILIDLLIKKLNRIKEFIL